MYILYISDTLHGQKFVDTSHPYAILTQTVAPKVEVKIIWKEVKKVFFVL